MARAGSVRAAWLPLLDEGGLVLFGSEEGAVQMDGLSQLPHYKSIRNHVGESLLNIALADECHMRLQPTIISPSSRNLYYAPWNCLDLACIPTLYHSVSFPQLPCNHSLSTLGVALTNDCYINIL